MLCLSSLNKVLVDDAIALLLLPERGTASFAMGDLNSDDVDDETTGVAFVDENSNAGD